MSTNGNGRRRTGVGGTQPKRPWPQIPRLTYPPRVLPLPLQRCEEVEAMRGQVSQEQELRAVVESCLLEQDGARKDVHAQLQETWALARDAALVLEQLR